MTFRIKELQQEGFFYWIADESWKTDLYAPWETIFICDYILQEQPEELPSLLFFVLRLTADDN